LTLPPFTFPTLPPFTLPNLGALGLGLSAALNGIGGSISASLNGLGASLNAMLSGSLNLGTNLNAFIQTGETLAANFAGNVAAGLNTAIQTGESLAANFAAALSTLSIPNLGLSINAALSANLGVALNGLLQATGSLAGGLTGGLAGLVHAGETLGGSLATGLSGLAGTGNALVTIWENTAAQVGGALFGGFAATLGVGAPGVLGLAADLATGLSGAASTLEQTGGSVVVSINTALTDLELALQAAIEASLGIGVAA
jgi:hypothetical protein